MFPNVLAKIFGTKAGRDIKALQPLKDAINAREQHDQSCQYVADPQRLGIGGWSYGGYMAEWAITQTNRFKAAVSGAGLSNLVSEFWTEFGPAYDKWFFGRKCNQLCGKRSTWITAANWRVRGNRRRFKIVRAAAFFCARCS